MPSKPNKKQYNSIRLIAVVVVILLIIFAFWLLIDIPAVIKQLKSANLRFLAAASVMLLLGMAAFAARWRLLLENKPTFNYTFHASNMGHAFNILLPFRAGEAVRVIVMGRSGQVSMTESTSSFFVERLFEQIMRLVTLIAAILIGSGLTFSPLSIIGGLLFLAAAFSAIAWLVNHQEVTLEKGVPLLARLPRVNRENARHSLEDLLNNLTAVSVPSRFAKVLAWSFVSWGFFWGFFYFTLLAIPNAFPSNLWLPVSLGALALSPPSATTQPGLFHVSLVVPLTAIGFDAIALTAYAILLHIQEMFWVIGLGLVGMLATGSKTSALLGHAENIER